MFRPAALLLRFTSKLKVSEEEAGLEPSAIVQCGSPPGVCLSSPPFIALLRPRSCFPFPLPLPAVVGAPLAHIFVSLSKRYPQYKRPLLWLVVGSTAFAVVNRLWLMGDAGYPGSEDSSEDANAKTVTMTAEEAAKRYWTSQALLVGRRDDIISSRGVNKDERKKSAPAPPTAATTAVLR